MSYDFEGFDPNSQTASRRQLRAADQERIYRRFAHAAMVRSRAAAVMWLAAVAAQMFGVLPSTSFLGISAALLYVIAINPPTLLVLRRLSTRGGVIAWSLVVHALEIVGYTAAIHFSGGIEATNLTLIYAALIAYAGFLGRARMPFLVAGMCSLAFTLMVVAEQVGWLPHHELMGARPVPWRTQVIVTLVTVSLLFVVASLAARASRSLWSSKRKLRESESQFRTLVDNVPGIVHLSVPGVEPRILFLGGSVEEMTGRSVDQLSDELKTMLDLCHPEDRSAVGSKKDLAVLERTDYVVDYRIRNADGEWSWVEERGQPIFDEKGRLQLVSGMVLEISERKTLEREKSLRRVIQQVAQEWQVTFDTVESPVLILDTLGRIRRLNRAAQQLATLPWDEVKGRRLGSLEGEPWETAAELVKAVQETEERGQSMHRTTSSETRYWQLTATLTRRFWDERVVLVLQDATEVVELEDSLRRGEKLAAIGALVGGVAHEVRNPLFGVSATLDAMRASFADDTDLRPYLDGLRSQVDRMTNLMNGLLAYGRSAGLERKDGSLHEVIERAAEDCSPLAAEVRVAVELELELELDDAVVPMNREAVVSLFSNLISNALQHSPPGSTVSVMAGTHEDAEGDLWVDATVHDQGRGFGVEALERGCEPFFSRRPGGLGLGLAIVERIVEDHGGRLRLTNGDEGGARVRVRLPAERRQPDTEEKPRLALA